MSQLLTIGRRALGTVAATVVAIAVLLATGAAVLAGPTVWSQLTGRIRIETVRQGSLQRQVRIYVPAVRARRPALVLNLQGAGGNGAFQEAITGFDAQADRLGWIVAYPDAEKGGWHTFGCCESNSNVDDVGFMATVMDQLEATEAVDPSRIYVTGASRGGMMAYRLACELSARLAAIAPVAGNLADASGSASAVPCVPSRPISVLDIHGSADPEIPIDGGRSSVNVEDVAYAPLDDVMARWRELDRCSGSPTTTLASRYRLTTWGCQGGSVVESLVVDGAGHTYPGALVANAPGSAAADIDASRLIADFFASRQARGGGQ